ncbi:hypothetical protein ANO11243_067470 [Dothideomycetidae sp. 11243]|nr:hypothetical protein ANO11243_067470 [fungal sp. No.11243]
MHRRFHLRLANIYDPSTIFFVNVSLPLSGPDCTACIGLVAPTFHGSPCFSGTTSTCPRSHVKVSEDAPPRPPEPMPSWRKHHNRRLSGAGKGTSFIANEPSVGDTISIVDLQEKGGPTSSIARFPNVTTVKDWVSYQSRFSAPPRGSASRVYDWLFVCLARQRLANKTYITNRVRALSPRDAAIGTMDAARPQDTYSGGLIANATWSGTRSAR